MNILIVEDNQDFSLLLSILIKKVLQNVRIESVSTTDDAIQKLPFAHFIVTDFQFPISGFLGLLSKIQEHNCPFILISGCQEFIKNYDTVLQVDAIFKDQYFMHNFTESLKSISKGGFKWDRQQKVE